MPFFVKAGGVNIALPTGIGGIDAYTKVMLHMNGTDASTTFIDETGKAFTAYGNAQIDTAQYKFGGSSGLFDGDEDYLNLASASADLNMQTAGDWTVDCWIRPASITGMHTIAHFYKAASAQGLHIYTNGAAINIDNGLAASGLSAGTLVINTWTHIAVIRASGTTKGYINGTLVDSEAAQDYGDNSSFCQIGRFYLGADTLEFNGWINEFRVSKGVARWTANFTPPTEAYTT